MGNEVTTTTAAVNAFGHVAFNAGQAAGIRRAIKEMRLLVVTPDVLDAIELLEAQALGLELNNRREA